MHPLEITAAALGLVTIVLLVRRNVWNFPFALAAVAAAGWLFLQSRLYSSALLQVLFFALNLYGWRRWASVGGHEHAVAVGRMTPPARLVGLAAMAVAILVWGAVEARYTDGLLPWADAAVTVASIAAQVLLARCLVENWVLWIGVNLVSIPLYAAGGLMLLAGLYGVNLMLAIVGYVEWRRAGAEGAHA